MAGITGNTLLDSPPSFTQSSEAQGFAKTGGIDNVFKTGSFNVGGSSFNSMFFVGAVLAGIYFLSKRKK